MKRTIMYGLAVTAMSTVSAPAWAGQCRDPWVTQAVTAVQSRAPIGAGDSGECNTKLYGNGRWSSYADLLAKVRAAYPKPTAGLLPRQLAPMSDAERARIAGGPIVPGASANMPRPSGLVSDNGGGLLPNGQPR